MWNFRETVSRTCEDWCRWYRFPRSRWTLSPPSHQAGPAWSPPYSLLKSTGVYKVPYNFIFFLPTPFFILDLLHRNFRPLPLFTLDILPKSLNIWRKMKLLPLSQRHILPNCNIAMIFPSPLHNLIFFSNRLDKPHPLPPVELYAPLEFKPRCCFP